MSFLPYVPTNTKAKLVDVVTSNLNAYSVLDTQSVMLSLTLANTRTVTLPAIPFDNQQVIIIDEANAASTYNITIDGNGKNINGSGSAVINKDKATMGLMFDQTANNWKIWLNTSSISGIEPIETADPTYAPVGNLMLSMTYTGERLVTLPASPVNGQNFIIIDAAGTANMANISVNGNGKKFDTGEDYILINKTKGIVGLTFNTLANKWIIYLNDYGSTGNDNFLTRNMTDGTLSLNTLHKVDSSQPRVLTLPYGTEGAFIIIQEKSGIGYGILVQVPQIPEDWVNATEAVLSNSTARDWRGISIAPNNLEALASMNSGQIWKISRSSISLDWSTGTESVLVNSGTRYWYGLSIAPNNLEALACVNGGQIYRLSRPSTLIDWTAATESVLTNSGTRNWSDVSIAPNGVEALACAQSGRIYVLRRASTSVDWNTATESVLVNSTVKDWRGISIAPNNLEALVCTYNGQIYRFERNSIFDSWTTATQAVITASSILSWYRISIAPNNLEALACFNGGVYKLQRTSTSVDWTAATETVIAGVGNRSWYGISIAPNNLEALACVVTNGKIYRLKRNSTWSTERIAGDTEMYIDGAKWSLELTYSGNEWSLT